MPSCRGLDSAISLPSRGRHGHARSGSRVSKASAVGVVGRNGDTEEMEQSVVSVRKSTLDLVEWLREQEVQERERVLSWGRVSEGIVAV